MIVNNAKYLFSSMNISKFYYTVITPNVVQNLIVRDHPIFTRDIMIAGTKYISIWLTTIFKKE